MNQQQRFVQKWQELAPEINERFTKLAQAKGKLTSDPEITSFLTLAICGEAGELANLIKKEWRGDWVDASDIQSEMADIRIYLEHLARHLNFDLDAACEKKLSEVHERLLTKGV